MVRSTGVEPVTARFVTMLSIFSIQEVKGCFSHKQVLLSVCFYWLQYFFVGSKKGANSNYMY